MKEGGGIGDAAKQSTAALARSGGVALQTPRVAAAVIVVPRWHSPWAGNSWTGHVMFLFCPPVRPQGLPPCTRSSTNPYYAFKVGKGVKLGSWGSMPRARDFQFVCDKKRAAPTCMQCKINGQVKCDCATTPGAPGIACASYQVNGKWIGSSRCEGQAGNGDACWWVEEGGMTLRREQPQSTALSCQ